MEGHTFFTEDEKGELTRLFKEIFSRIESTLKPEDCEKVKQYVTAAVSGSEKKPDIVGFNPVLIDLQTSLFLVKELGMKREVVIANMIHYAVTSGKKSEEEVKRDFGDDVATIVHGMTRVYELYRKSPVIESEDFRTLFITFAEDMRVILIMIANRLILLRLIKDSPNAEARQLLAQEAAYLYAPLAHKLGLYQIKSELEDLSLKYLDHDAYYHIKEKLNATKRARDIYVENFIAPIREKLEQAGLKFHMKGRTKSIHSIWQKMKRQKCPFEGVYDLFAIRIILDSAPEREKMECWQVFSIITDMYQSNPKRMRDWLSVPKSNGYESLHITVLGPEQKWVEVQIRTERMDEIAEHGLAAHWRYKGVKQGEMGIEEWLANIRSALECNDDLSLMDQFKRDTVKDEVFVFTPKGDLFKLPNGATILDFAYAIHTNVGNHCVGARIGHKNVPLRQKLVSGDQVEILTSNNQTPKQDWLNFTTTSKAKSKIRQSLKEMEMKESAYAKELLERKFKNRKMEMEESIFAQTIKKFGYKIATEFYKDVAHEKISPNEVLETYIQLKNREEGQYTVNVESAENYNLDYGHEGDKQSSTGDDVLVIDKNLKGVEFSLSKCCNPIYGDDVFGLVTVSQGIRIHRTDCPNAKYLRERLGYRIVKARWAGKGKSGKQYPVTLHVVGNDDITIVSNITSIISKEEKTTLRSIRIDSNDGLFSGHLTLMIEDQKKMEDIIKKLKTVKGVKSVSR
jgi:GTP pyrophosphokinase